VVKSTRSAPARKPSKPHPDFPLFPHRSDRWCKKLKGKFHYFGKVSTDTDGVEALKRWLEVKDDLLAGREPRRLTGDELTLKDLVNRYLTTKQRALDAGEIAPRTFGEYYATCQRVLEQFGKEKPAEHLLPDDFGKLRAVLAKTRGPTALGNEITRVKMIFKFADDEGLLTKAVRFGQSFSKPAKKVYDKVAAERGAKDFQSDELRLILDAMEGKPVAIEGQGSPTAFPAAPILRAIVLLSINAGFGQTDIALVPKSAIDLKGGWVTFPRPKTGVPRRAKLWRETIEAVREAIAARPAAADPSEESAAFLMSTGRRWVRVSNSDDPKHWKARTDILGKVFGVWLDRLGVGGNRGFYGIRHSFQTAAETCLDLPAVMHCMGHADPSMSARYRGEITDARLEAVAAAVHKWLFQG
jgi:integrase